MNNNPIILSIETSCDETAAAITFARRVLSNIIHSQIEVHKEWGGVVPNLAKREHKEHIGDVIETALKRANRVRKHFNLPIDKIKYKKLDAVAVTRGPGLAPSLEVGIEKAKQLSCDLKKPLTAINHMEAHLLSSFALNSKGKGPLSSEEHDFPFLGLLISGGHTQLVLMKKFGKYELLGETLDDAAGEAFDKVAKMLDLGYPGGPIIEKLAEEGNADRFELPVPMRKHKSLNFSFSGLKTACMYKIKEFDEKTKNAQFYKDFSASFQKVLTKSITNKLEKAMDKYPVNKLLLGGGVINNLYVRNKIRQTAKKYSMPVTIPYSDRLLGDNAAMIGIAAYYKYKRKEFVKDIYSLERRPSLNFNH